MRESVWICACALLALVPLSCDDDPKDEPPVPVEEFELSVGTYESDAFHVLAPDDVVEIIVGFQGLIFIDLALQADQELPTWWQAETQVTFVDSPDLSYSFRSNRVELESSGSGVLNRAFRVPFGLDIGLLHGQRIEVEVTVRATGWEGNGATEFLIEDNEQCTEDPNGDLICEDDS